MDLAIAGLVARFHDPGAGAVPVDGRDLRTITQRSLRRQMALVPQDPFLFPGTLADNIRFGRPEASDADVGAAARAANADGFIARLLEGRTALVIAHRLSTIRAAHQICVVEGGKIVERGRHEDLVARGGAYARLYAEQYAGA